MLLIVKIISVLGSVATFVFIMLFFTSYGHTKKEVFIYSVIPFFTSVSWGIYAALEPDKSFTTPLYFACITLFVIGFLISAKNIKNKVEW